MLFGNKTRHAVKDVTCQLIPSMPYNQILTANYQLLKGSQCLQAQSFGEPGCIDRPRNRIDTDSTVLVFRASKHY